MAVKNNSVVFENSIQVYGTVSYLEQATLNANLTGFPLMMKNALRTLLAHGLDNFVVVFENSMAEMLNVKHFGNGVQELLAAGDLELEHEGVSDDVK